MKIAMRSLSDGLSQMPDIKPLEIGEQNDLFISVLGFEERALAVSRMLSAGGFRCGTAMYVQYRNPKVDNSANLPGLMSSLMEVSATPPIVIPDFEAGKRIRTHIQSLANVTNREVTVTLDLSAASVALILQFMHALIDLPVSLRICYTEADLYFPTKEDYSSNPQTWLSDDNLKTEIGVDSVRISPDYPGQHSVLLPHSFILVPNFNPARAKAMLASWDEGLIANPTRAVTWLIGVPHLAESAWRCQALKEINEVEDIQPQLEVGTFDYKDIIRVLDQLWNEQGRNRNITLALLGSKFQTLGSALFCELHPEVRVVTSSPTEFRQKRYSRGIRELWQVQFGSLKTFREILLSCGEWQIAGD
jgi:hypothetical protein